jgi:hypothetical protein
LRPVHSPPSGGGSLTTSGASRDWGCKRSEPFQSKVEL